MDCSTSLYGGVWNDAMKCFVWRIEIEFQYNLVTFVLAEMNVADKRGAIETAKAHLPTVQEIAITAPGKKPYEWLLKAGKWVKYGCP